MECIGEEEEEEEKLKFTVPMFSTYSDIFHGVLSNSFHYIQVGSVIFGTLEWRVCEIVIFLSR